MTANVISKSSLFIIIISIILSLQIELGQACWCPCFKRKKKSNIKNSQPKKIYDQQKNKNDFDTGLDLNEIIVDVTGEKDEVKESTDLTNKNINQIKKVTKYSKVHTHLHRSILQYLDDDSSDTYRYLRNMMQWNPQGIFAGDVRPTVPEDRSEDKNDTNEDVSLIQRFIDLDLVYNCSKICAPNQNQILQKNSPTITFPLDTSGIQSRDYEWDGTESLMMTYNFHTRVLKYPKILIEGVPHRLHRAIDFSTVLLPFSTMFFTIGGSVDIKSILQLQWIEWRDISLSSYTYSIKFKTTIHQHAVTITYIFFKHYPHPAICSSIKIHMRYLEETDLYFDYGREFIDNVYPNEKKYGSSHIEIYYWQHDFRNYHDIKNDDIKKIVDLFQNQSIYVQFF